MFRLLRATAPGSWLRLPRRTARLRLTLLYSGMFLVMGTLLLVGTYLLSSSSDTIAVSAVPVHESTSSAAGGGAAPLAPVRPIPPGLQRHVLNGIASGVVQQHSADLQRLLATSWILLVLTAIVSAVLGWIASGRVLRPLRQMAETARTISAGSLGQRLALTGPDDEFKALGDTLDDLLARLETAFEAQRRFVANASHELRTPLTVERTLLQVALADPNASEATLRATCEEILACGAEHERLLESLLTLTSSERGLTQREPVDLAQVATRVLLTPRADVERKALVLDADLNPALAAGDPPLIERLVANLVDNAVRYNHAGGRVMVRTQRQDGHALVSVANTGPVIDPDETDRLFEPFQRLGGDRTAPADGRHGLGLSIVSAIATAHEATVSATPQPTGGLAVTVSFAHIDVPATDESPALPAAATRQSP